MALATAPLALLRFDREGPNRQRINSNARRWRMLATCLTTSHIEVSKHIKTSSQTEPRTDPGSQKVQQPFQRFQAQIKLISRTILTPPENGDVH
eukprot:5648325-Prymnesium_polylepis.1